MRRFISFHHDALIRIFYDLDVAKTIINNQKRSLSIIITCPNLCYYRNLYNSTFSILLS